MIPHTYPSVLTETNTRQMVIYPLTDITGLQEWVDYIPVKAPLDESLTTLAGTFANEGFLYSTTLTSIDGLVAFKDYIPVYIKTAGTIPWSTNFAGYIPLANLFSILNLFANGEQGAWYDPSDLSTMFQDAAGTIPVTAAGQAVGLILDKSGRGNHATQTTSTKRPVLQQDANGKYYLLFDGIDDALQTASVNFTGTDKVTVWVGVRKLSDAATSVLAELSLSVDTNNGSFSITAPSGNGSNSYRFTNKGTTQSLAGTGIFAAAPDTAVIACIGDISGNVSKLRRNTTDITTNILNQGAVNYGNYPLYIGSRGGTTLPFNGRLYSLIIRGAQSTATQISNAETYVNSKTGAY